MATIVATPNPGVVGKPVTIAGEGFANSTEVLVGVDADGYQAEIVSSSATAFATDAIADHATGTLTGTGNPNAGEQMVVGSKTYTFRANLATLLNPNDILIGAALTNTLDNIKAAINGDAGEGSLFGPGTTRNPDAFASNKTATTVVFHARVAGTAGNSIVTTETMTNNSFGGGTLTGGAAAGARAMVWTPQRPGTYNVQASDGTNSATVQVRIFTSG